MMVRFYCVNKLCPIRVVSVVVSVEFSFYFAWVRGVAEKDWQRTRVNTGDFRRGSLSCAALHNAFVGINSEVSYQLDHAPALPHTTMNGKDLMDIAKQRHGPL